MTALRQRMIRELELQRKSAKTIQAYVRAVAQLAQHYGRTPDRISLDEVRGWLHYLITQRKQAFSSVNQKLAGLRVSEVVRLQPADIHAQRLLIRVRQGKGHKDRYTLLSPRLLEELREHWRQERPQTWLFEGRQPGAALSIDGAQRIFYRAKHRGSDE